MLDFRKSHLPQSELVRWLADLIYPVEAKDLLLKKRLRSHIDKAIIKGLLVKKVSDGLVQIETQGFLRWLSRKKVRNQDWGQLLKEKHPKIYIPLTKITVSGVTAEGLVGHPSTEPLPTDLKSAHQEILKLRSENNRLRNENAAYRKNEKDRQQYIRRQRGHGKAGGRGNEK